MFGVWKQVPSLAYACCIIFFPQWIYVHFFPPKRLTLRYKHLTLWKNLELHIPIIVQFVWECPKYLKIQFKVIFLYDTIWGMVLVLEFLCDQIKKILYLSICAHGVLVLPLPPPSWAHWGRLGRSFTCTSLGLRTHDLLRW
jgi:hypothetical protein